MIDQAEKWAESALRRLRISCSVCGEIDVAERLRLRRGTITAAIKSSNVNGIESVPMCATFGGLVASVGAECLLREHEIRFWLE